jgi:hypothetical protein
MLGRDGGREIANDPGFGAVFANTDPRRFEIAYLLFGLADRGTWVWAVSRPVS